MPGENYSQSHITLVPPRPLRAPLDAVSAFAHQKLERFPPFEVVLGDVHRFPETNVLYLDLAVGHREVHLLHDALNEGVLAHGELFEFRPHLTIGGPLPEPEISALHREASQAWTARNGANRFQVSEAVALWWDPADRTLEWQRLWTKELRADLIPPANGSVRDRTS
jgi:2'-5' RNA ligase